MYIVDWAYEVHGVLGDGRENVFLFDRASRALW